MHARLDTHLWRHDAYTLRRMQGAFERAIVGLLNAGVLDKERSSVVDMGAGDVPYRPLFEDHCKTYMACDLEMRPGIDVVFDDCGTLPLPSGTADCIVSFQVLEHVWDLDTYLSECHRILKEEGRLILSTHGTWLYHPHPGDYRRWTRDGLCRDLELRGFEIETIDAVVGPLAWTTQFRTFAYHHVLSKLGPIGRLVAAAFCMAMYPRMVIEDWATPKALHDTNAAVYCVTARIRR